MSIPEALRPLILTSFGKHAQVVERLLRNANESNVEVDPPTDFGGTAIHYAADVGDYQIVDMLIDANAKAVNGKEKTGRTPLHWAADHGHFDVVRLLLRHGADINAVTNDGETAFHLAAGGGHLDVINYLEAR